ncbi:ERF family protein [Lentibacillus salicampi]|uniref:Single-stranded DNA-binding protein n=1 Tax=Lentibacillus salicampi TaxID=175306 RepID=A0A4Y9A8K3_9BACI|nr:ERF family protein [Lentibacillus salicampi]TFJ92169.1 hypothetical protein E4U82_13905 [Lentibacillus salicampi]
MNEKSLIKKLAHVMKQVQYIEKKGWNSFNKYKYATESDVQEKVREELADQNVIMLPDVVEHSTREHINRKNHTEYIATVKVKFTFFDGDSGETIEIHSAGEGQDAGDKAVYKAITGAQKYALMKAFMIPTGDDPEGDNGVDERNNQQQKKPQKQPSKSVIQAKFKKAGGTDEQFNEWFAKQSSAGVTNQQMDDLMTKKLKEGGKNAST